METELVIPSWFWQFLCEGLSSFNSKGFYYSSAWSCRLCERRTSFSMRCISRKLLWILTYVFNWLYFSQCLTSFSSSDHLLCLCAQFFILFHVTNYVLSINPSTNVYVFGGFHVHPKNWLTSSSGTDRPGVLCYNFLISNNLTQMVNFPTRISCSNSQWSALFYCIAYDYCCADWDGLSDHLRDVPWKNIYSLLWLGSGWTDVYIPHHKYKVKPR